MTTQTSQLAFMESQAAHIERESRMIQHGDINYPGMVYIDRAASPYATVITHYSYDGTGSMIYLANRGNDYPLVEVQQAQHNVNIEWLALAYDWSDREIGQAMMMSLPLAERKTMIAFRIWEETKDDIFLNGNSAFGWDGFLNVSNVTIEAATGTFATQTALVIADDINKLLGGVWVGTNKQRMADTLCMPTAQLNILATKPIGDNANRNALAYIKENNIYTLYTNQPLNIKAIDQLSTAGVSNVARAVAYSRDRNVVRFHIPQELQFDTPMRQYGGWVYPGHGVAAGLEVREPNGFRYMDGI